MAIPNDCGDHDDGKSPENEGAVSAHFWKSYDQTRALFRTFGTLVAFLSKRPKAGSAKTTAFRLDRFVGSRKRNVSDPGVSLVGRFSGLGFRHQIFMGDARFVVHI